MSRPTELFAIAAIVLLALGLLSKFLLPPQALGLTLIPRMGYIFPVGSVFVFLAALLCVAAAVYAFWLVPMNQKAALWHFWLTAAGIVLFWSGFFLFLKYHPSGDLHGGALAVAIGWLASFPLILIAQGIFLVNLISGLMKVRTLP